jgi:hypothetical protein
MARIWSAVLATLVDKNLGSSGDLLVPECLVQVWLVEGACAGHFPSCLCNRKRSSDHERNQYRLCSLLKALRQSCLEGLNLSLLRLLFDTRSFHASDRRDKIYGLLGICDSEELMTVNPDYSKSVKEVYRALAVHYIKQGSLDILTAVCDPYWRRLSFLPSWVPDWSTMPRLTEFLRPSDSIRANAAKNLQAEVDSLEEGTCLNALGFRIDTVSSTHKPYFFRSFEEQIASGDRIPKLFGDPTQGGETLLRMGVRTLCWQRCAMKLKSYPTNEKPLFVFLKTIVAGGPVCGGKESALQAHYESFCLVNMFKRRKRILTDEDYTNSGIFSKAFYRASWGRTMFVTKQGYLGIGPYSMRSGDKVVILRGEDTYILRKEKKDGYSLVGECYVHGIVHGEALKDDQGIETFSISRPAMDALVRA